MEAAAYIEAELSVHFHTPFHLGAGHGDVSINRVVKRNASRRPYVPASALKGALRMAAERVIQVVDNLVDPGGSVANRQRKGHEVQRARCRAPHPPAMCQSKKPCLVCRVFGNGYTGVRLLVDDALADELDVMTVMHEKVFKKEPVLAHSETITRVQIDRKNKGARKGALFSSEYTPPTQDFKAKVSGRLPLSIIDETVPPLELILLAASVSFVEHIGAEVSVGRGHCHVTFGDGVVSGTHRDDADEKRTEYSFGALIDNLEYLSYFDRM